ncbi:MAG: hypothetical protein QT08_C0024G0005 [archaeon GW2011_AR17]|nr:MAG: hypothetical protein QT08_C0024G0005 [archaeon GW2011_AR17]MBS3154279.1 hypothetical protein [Candidatus Woesearchaeota archaeon]HIH14841.1 hypothetical protein [Nanoarchaeota archaeon]HIH58900.1 hypothetical protein [Nanoarchaeota archaeon]HII14010.1 hypothetical protein [Nanoarchaeota archaeon]
MNISTPHRKIELALANRIFLKQIKEMLLDFDIKTSKTYSMITSKGFKKYAFYVRTNSNLSIFSKMIGFNHPLKKSSLGNILLHPGRISYAHGGTQGMILLLLKDMDLTVAELVPLLNRHQSTIRFALLKLKCKGLVFSKSKTFKKGGGILWSLDGQTNFNT